MIGYDSEGRGRGMVKGQMPNGQCVNAFLGCYRFDMGHHHDRVGRG